MVTAPPPGAVPADGEPPRPIGTYRAAVAARVSARRARRRRALAGGCSALAVALVAVVVVGARGPAPVRAAADAPATSALPARGGPKPAGPTNGTAAPGAVPAGPAAGPELGPTVFAPAQGTPGGCPAGWTCLSDASLAGTTGGPVPVTLAVGKRLVVALAGGPGRSWATPEVAAGRPTVLTAVGAASSGHVALVAVRPGRARVTAACRGAACPAASTVVEVVVRG